MQLASTLALLTSYFGLVTAIGLPDGVWEGTTFANGTYWVKPAGAPDSGRFLFDPVIQERWRTTASTRPVIPDMPRIPGPKFGAAVVRGPHRPTAVPRAPD